MSNPGFFKSNFRNTDVESRSHCGTRLRNPYHALRRIQLVCNLLGNRLGSIELWQMRKLLL